MSIFSTVYSLCITSLNLPSSQIISVHLRGHSKSMSIKHRHFWPLSPHVKVIRLEPPPIVTLQKVTNFKLKMSRPLMQILGLIFAKTCIFFYTYTWRATLKIRWSGVITVFIGILMRLLKQYFFKGVASLFDSYPLSLYHTLSSFWSSPLPPRRVTYFLNDPYSYSLWCLYWNNPIILSQLFVTEKNAQTTFQ